MEPSNTLDPLLQELARRQMESNDLREWLVGYVDMLGFSSLVRSHPGTLAFTGGNGEPVGVQGSESHARFTRFQNAMDRLAFDAINPHRPHRMMVFSDCAFCVYDNPTQAAASLAEVMRRLLASSVPAKMCLARGTCHAQRFSVETTPSSARFIGC
jgi:hypothetical protein